MGKLKRKGLTMARKGELRGGVSDLWGPMKIDAERSRQPWKRISHDAFEEALDTLGIEKPREKTPALAKNGARKEKS